MDLSSESGRLRCTVVFTTDKTAPLLSIANATTADVDTVLAIWNEGLRSAPADGGPHDWEMSQHMALEWVLGHQQQMRPLWLARLGEQPVALLSFIGFSDRPGCHATAELAVHVRRGYRGQGVGRTLVQRSIASAAMLGYDRYLALVRRDNKSSLALFRHCGFRLWGRLHGITQGNGRRHDVLVFGIEL